VKVEIREIDVRETALGDALYIKMHAEGFPELSWGQCWEAFAEAYPGKWAVSMFPPADQLVDGKCMYHLFVLDGEPRGLNIR